MSYHRTGWGQADWFYGKPSAEASSQPAQASPTPQASPISSPPMSPPSPGVAPSPPSAELYEEEEGGGYSLIFWAAGIGILGLAGFLIYKKFSSPAVEEEEELEVVEPPAEPETEPAQPKKKPKTIKVEITTDEED